MAYIQVFPLAFIDGKDTLLNHARELESRMNADKTGKKGGRDRGPDGIFMKSR